MIRRIVSSSLACLALAAPLAAADQPDAVALFGQHCASCHAETRLGGTGPALIPETLGRLKGEALESIIAKGRVATQMPAFEGTLSKAEIAAVAAWIGEPLAGRTSTRPSLTCTAVRRSCSALTANRVPRTSTSLPPTATRKRSPIASGRTESSMRPCRKWTISVPPCRRVW
jgi:cytochrome c553